MKMLPTLSSCQLPIGYFKVLDTVSWLTVLEFLSVIDWHIMAGVNGRQPGHLVAGSKKEEGARFHCLP
jgi:hypothetical protein